MTEGIPYSGDISVTSSGLHCIEWDWYRRALLDEPNQSLHLVDIGLFPDETYSELGAKCRYVLYTLNIFLILGLSVVIMRIP